MTLLLYIVPLVIAFLIIDHISRKPLPPMTLEMTCHISGCGQKMRLHVGPKIKGEKNRVLTPVEGCYTCHNSYPGDRGSPHAMYDHDIRCSRCTMIYNLEAINKDRTHLGPWRIVAFE